jgi:hypothetical protein
LAETAPARSNATTPSCRCRHAPERRLHVSLSKDKGRRALQRAAARGLGAIKKKHNSREAITMPPQRRRLHFEAPTRNRNPLAGLPPWSKHGRFSDTHPGMLLGRKTRNDFAPLPHPAAPSAPLHAPPSLLHRGLPPLHLHRKLGALVLAGAAPRALISAIGAHCSAPLDSVLLCVCAVYVSYPPGAAGLRLAGSRRATPPQASQGVPRNPRESSRSPA